MGLISRLAVLEKDYVKRRIMSVSGNARMHQSTRGTSIHVLSGAAATNTFLQISINATTNTTIDVSEGFGWVAGVPTVLSDGAGVGVGDSNTNTITGYNGADGSWYAIAELTFTSGILGGTWALVKNTTVNVFPGLIDDKEHYILGKVTVTDNVISSVQQYWFGGHGIYEPRV